jgi:hypothetical protein
VTPTRCLSEVQRPRRFEEGYHAMLFVFVRTMKRNGLIWRKLRAIRFSRELSLKRLAPVGATYRWRLSIAQAA